MFTNGNKIKTEHIHQQGKELHFNIKKLNSDTLRLIQTKTRRCTILTRESWRGRRERAGESELEMREPAKKTDKLKPKILYKPIRGTGTV